MYPSDEAAPTASSINFPKGWTGANMVTVPVGADGQGQALQPRGTAHAIVDVLGWYADDDRCARPRAWERSSIATETGDARTASTTAGTGRAECSSAASTLDLQSTSWDTEAQARDDEGLRGQHHRRGRDEDRRAHGVGRAPGAPSPPRPRSTTSPRASPPRTWPSVTSRYSGAQLGTDDRAQRLPHPEHGSGPGTTSSSTSSATTSPTTPSGMRFCPDAASEAHARHPQRHRPVGRLRRRRDPHRLNGDQRGDLGLRSTSSATRRA